MKRTIVALAVAAALVVGAIVVSANAADSSTLTRLDARAVLVDANGTTGTRRERATPGTRATCRRCS
jgi:hypothetical protein